MKPLSEWLDNATTLSMAEFAARHPDPFLVWWTDPDQAKPIHHAVYTMDRMVVGATPSKHSIIEHYLACPIRGRTTTTVGYSPDCDVPINDTSVSRLHAYLSRGPSGWQVRDANSLVGTVVNDAPPTDAPLASGDRITVGNVDLLFLNPAAVYELIRRLELF